MSFRSGSLGASSKSVIFSTMEQVSFSGINRIADASRAFSLSHESVRRIRILASRVLEQSDMAMMNQLIHKWRTHAPHFFVGFAAFDCTTESVNFLLLWIHLDANICRVLFGMF